MSGGKRVHAPESSTPRHRGGRRTRRPIVLAIVLGLASPLPRAALAQSATPLDSDPSAGEPVFSLDSPVGPIDYHAGRGLHIGRTGLTIGGFTTVEIDDPQDESATLELDSVNFLLLWEPVDFFRAFAEIEVGGLFSIESHHGDVDGDIEGAVERLYADLRYNDALNLRFGKFQTPIGRWNLVPAEPFTWTSVDPIQVDLAFDEHQTAAALFGSLYPGGNVLSYWVYGQFTDALDPDPDTDPADRTWGARLEYGAALGEWSVGSSFYAAKKKGDWSYLTGLDFQLHLGPLELTSEAVYETSDVPENDLWGVYLQGVYDLGSLHGALRNVYFVGRYEHWRPEESSGRANIYDLGLTWIPKPYLTIKAGYRLSDRRTEDVRPGFTASVSLLF